MNTKFSFTGGDPAKASLAHLAEWQSTCKNNPVPVCHLSLAFLKPFLMFQATFTSVFYCLLLDFMGVHWNGQNYCRHEKHSSFSWQSQGLRDPTIIIDSVTGISLDRFALRFPKENRPRLITVTVYRFSFQGKVKCLVLLIPSACLQLAHNGSDLRQRISSCCNQESKRGSSGWEGEALPSKS